MAFPTVAGRHQTAPTANGTSHSIAIGSPTAGQTVVIVVQANANVTFSLAGWTELYDVVGGGVMAQAAFSKVATGSEGASVSITTSGSASVTGVAFRINNAGSTTPAVATAAALSTPDSPNLSPAGGAKDFLWIATAGYTSTTNQAAAPTNFANLTQGSAGVTSPKINVADRSQNAASQDPAAWPTATGVQTLAATIAVFPAPAFVDRAFAVDAVSSIVVAATVASYVAAAFTTAAASSITFAAGLASYVTAAFAVAATSSASFAAGVATYVNAALAVAAASSVSFVARVTRYFVPRSAVFVVREIRDNVGARIRTFIVRRRV